MNGYLGDFLAGATLYLWWDTVGSTGASITRATNGTVSVYKNSSTTQSTTGVTDTEDFDSLTGIHLVAIDTSADGTFYAAGNDFTVILSGATIDGVSVNAVLGTFSIENRNTQANLTLWRGSQPNALASGRVDADVGAISGDANAANNLESEYDGTGYHYYLRRNTAQSGGSSSITLDSGASSANDLYKGLLVALVSGTGAGQTRAITAYNGTTKAATVAAAWATNPDNTTVFQLLPWPETAVAPTNFASLAISGSGVVDANVAEISGDATAANNLESAADGTGYNLGGGQVVAASVTGAVGSVTGNVGGNVTGSVGSVSGNVGGNVVGSVGSLSTQAKADVNAEVDTALTDYDPATGTEAAAIKSDTAAILADTGTDGVVVSAGAISSIQSGLATSSALSTVGANVSDVVAVTDKLDTALESDGSGGYQYTALALENGPSGGGGGSGSGDYARLIRLVRPTSSAPLPGRKVTVYDSTQSTIIAAGYTDNSGEATFNLNADTYKIVVGANAADAYLAPQTLTMSGAGTTQYTVTAASTSGGTSIL